MKHLLLIVCLFLARLAYAADGTENKPKNHAEVVAAAASASQAAADAATRAAKAAAEATAAAEAAAKAAKVAKDLAESLGGSAPASVAKGPQAASEVAAASAPADGSKAVAITEAKTIKSIGGTTGAQLTANKDGGNATIKISQSPQDKQLGKLFELSLSSPLSKTTDVTEPASLDGLANAATVGVTWGRYRPWNREHLDTTAFYVYGGGLKAGYQKFDYFDATSLAKSHASRSPASASIFFGSTTSGRGNVLVLGKFEYQDSYKDADSKVLCPAGTPPTACVSGPIGTPKNTKKRIWSLEGRYTSANYELSPVLSYDGASKVKGLEVPVYFIGGPPDGDKPIPFNAGVSFGWRSDSHGSVSLFVGSPFSFWLP